MADQIKPPTLPIPPAIRQPTMSRDEVMKYLEVGIRGADPLRVTALYNTVIKMRVGGPPPQLVPLLAAMGMVGASVMEVVHRLSPPPREGATPEEIVAELPEWAREVLLAVGVLSNDEEPEVEEDLTARAARSGLVIGVG